MTEYISKFRARQIVLKHHLTGSQPILHEIEREPPARVGPVVFGEWIAVADPDDIPCRVRCCNCDWYQYWNSPYCPNCGAQMDGGPSDA